MQNIFNKIFKNVPTASVDVVMLETSESVPTVNENIEIQGMSDDEKLNCDKKQVDALSSQLILIHGVLNFITSKFSQAWHIEVAKNYPLITMEEMQNDKEHKLPKWEKERLHEGHIYATCVEDGWETPFYTKEGAVSYMEKYYEIRSKHLETLFPKL
jgi:hypothetical protein